tara:strand:+ start:43 stop:1311 length:1269 start_codon:yes stop_codon:yes gene_type:complete
MSKLTRAQLEALIASNFPDNNTQAITPQKVREFCSEVVDSQANEADDVIVNEIVPGTSNVSIDVADPEKPVISVSQTTAGLLTNVYFTADTVTTTEGAFYLTEIGGKGTAPAAVQTLIIGNTDGETPFGQDFLSIAAPSDSIIAPGTYAGFPLISLGSNDGKIRMRIEVYLTDGDGDPIAQDGPLGTLGVNTMLIADSGIKDIQAGRETGLGMSGTLGTSVTWGTGQRVRYRVLATKVLGDVSDQTFSLFSGTDYESFFQVPTPASDVITVAPTSIVTFAYAGAVPGTPSVMKTDSSFTIASGVYSGTISGAHVIGVRYTMGTFGSGPAGTVDIDVQAEPQGAGAQHLPGGGTNILSQNLVTTVAAVSTTYNKGGEFTFTPVELTQDTVFFIDVTKSAVASVNDLRVSLIIEYQDLAETRRL